MEGSFWAFNNHLLIFYLLKVEEDLLFVLLFWVDFWIHVHYLPTGLMFKVMAKQFGDFLGQFLDYDAKSISMCYRSYMRIRVRIDVRNLLKKRKKIVLGSKSCIYARSNMKDYQCFVSCVDGWDIQRDFA